MTGHANAAPVAQLELFHEPRRPRSDSIAYGIEQSFDIPFVAQLALKEKQIQQNYRPIIAVHKWFARRPGSLFRALLLSEFGTPPLIESYYKGHDFDGLQVADPFMGGGTPLLEANRVGCDVLGWDINPMSFWIVGQEIRYLDLGRYRQAAEKIHSDLHQLLGDLYVTHCDHCRREAQVKYFLWVKTRKCGSCQETFDLFPGYLLAAAGRHPRDVLVCACCGELNEVEDRHVRQRCRGCQDILQLKGPARRGQCKCPSCGAVNGYPEAEIGPPSHRIFALEYHCWHCKRGHRGRFFKRPDAQDLSRYDKASERWRDSHSRFVPEERIPRGDETDRLHRWGYRRYREMFNDRQLLGLETLSREIAQCRDVRSRHALATNLSDLLRYQNMLCRYDTSALKSLDIFSVHGFPVGLVQAESNLLGIRNPSNDALVGSGGWSNIVEKFYRAKQYCDAPFEIEVRNGRKVTVPIDGEWIGEERDVEGSTDSRQVRLACESATQARLDLGSLDAVLTDPPYFANIQYAELMDFCFVWLRRLINGDDPAFVPTSTRNPDELTGNVTMERDLEHFTAGLSEVFGRMARALKVGAPFAFTYHHNQLEAYFPVAVAMLDSGLICSASLPCPAEMGGSIHIHSTTSSIVDTVFICRTKGALRRKWLVETPAAIADLVNEELDLLRLGGVRVTRGDARCIAFGHTIRMVVWKLKDDWDRSQSWEVKLRRIAENAELHADFAAIEALLDPLDERASDQTRIMRRAATNYFVEEDAILF